MSTHGIRLLGPWQCLVHSEVAGESVIQWTGTITPPCPFPTVENLERGMVLFTRIFHPPTNLTGREQLALVFPGLLTTPSVTLNGTSLSSERKQGEGEWQSLIFEPLVTNNTLNLMCIWNAEKEFALPRLFHGAILEIQDNED